MTKRLPYIVAFILAFQAFTPPLTFEIHFVNNQVQFAWLFLLCAFALLSRAKDFLIAGLVIVAFTMMVHFPDRQNTVVPWLIAFAAFAEQQTRKEVYA